MGFFFLFYRASLPVFSAVRLQTSCQLKKSLCHKHCCTGTQRHCNHALFQVGRHKSSNQSGNCRNHTGRGRQNRRKRHGRQTRIGYVKQKRFQEGTCDFLPGQYQRKHANQIGDNCHHRYININIRTQPLLPPLPVPDAAMQRLLPLLKSQ